jgi:ubiquinone/menaquinone biosynthesis C-methylase UbiE
MFDVIKEIEKSKYMARKRFLRYTKRAFQMLPKLEEPRILDIGCGSGGPTLKLARLCKGTITGLDTDMMALERLKKKIESSGLSGRVQTMVCSMTNMDFPPDSFDIIWAEGSINVVGFRRGLIEWKPLIKQGGFLVVHDDAKEIPEKIRMIHECGYVLLDHFELPGKEWLRDYYKPLERKVRELRKKQRDNPNVREILDKEQQEIDKVKKEPSAFGSAFYVMKKK